MSTNKIFWYTILGFLGGVIMTVWVMYLFNIKINKVVKMNYVGYTAQWTLVEAEYYKYEDDDATPSGYYTLSLERTVGNEVQTRTCEIEEKYVEGKYTLGQTFDMP